MNEAVKAKWLAALRSGKYEQGTEHLNKDGKFCCLGVLCDIYSQENGVGWNEYSGLSGVKGMHGIYGVLPTPVQDYAGLVKGNPNVSVNKQVRGLASFNDAGSTFEELADLIETQL